MKFKKYLSLLICLGCFQIMFAQQEQTVSAKDFKNLIGSWVGSITYLDYTTNKPFTMPAELTIKQLAKSNTYIFANTYPKEPKANENDTITISANRRLINQEVVKSKRKLSDGNLEIVTEYLATDGNDNKPAIIRHTYTIGRTLYTSRKDVQFNMQPDWIKRSEYNYRRK